MFDAASVLIPYHLFLAGALIGTGILGAIVRGITRKHISFGFSVESIGIGLLLVIYVILIPMD